MRVWRRQTGLSPWPGAAGSGSPDIPARSRAGRKLGSYVFVRERLFLGEGASGPRLVSEKEDACLCLPPVARTWGLGGAL